jgi:hypothetical protein
MKPIVEKVLKSGLVDKFTIELLVRRSGMEPCGSRCSTSTR